MLTSTRLRRLLPALLAAAALSLLLLGLGTPDRIVFDETYYVGDALDYLDQGVESGFAVHPPMGKWMIAGSIALWGDTPFGWRFGGAVAGAAIVLLTYLIGVRLLRRPAYAALAALLVLTDGLLFVQARTSMLDIHLALFITLGIWLLLVDRDRSGLGDVPDEAADDSAEPNATDIVIPRLLSASDEAAADQDEDAGPVPPPYHGHALRWLAGISFGLALATKWSGALALAGAVAISLVWELSWRRRMGAAAWASPWRALGRLAAALVLVPALVYVLSYTPWLANYGATTQGQAACPDTGVACKVPLPERLGGLVTYQRKIYDFHSNLESDHRYRAPAYTWPLLARPVVYYYESCTAERASGVPTTNSDGEAEVPDPCEVAEGDAAEIIALGNPVLWWLFLPSLLLLALGVGRRDRAGATIAAFWGIQFLPWLIITRPLFIFYMTPAVPWLALGVAWAVLSLRQRTPLLWPFAGLGAGAALGLAAGHLVYSRVTPPDHNLRWVGLSLGALAGTALAALLDRSPAPSPATRTGRFARAGLPITIAVLATAMFLYFYPVLVGLPMVDAAVRQRWWFTGWI